MNDVYRQPVNAYEDSEDQRAPSAPAFQHELKHTKNIIDFIFGGQAVFTIRSKKTGKHYTYRVLKSKRKLNDKRPSVYFVSVNAGDLFQYLGIINDSGRYKPANPKDEPPSSVAFSWFWTHLEKSRETLQFYHEGRCAKCGRPLTNPESIEIGFGPTCRGE